MNLTLTDQSWLDAFEALEAGFSSCVDLIIPDPVQRRTALRQAWNRRDAYRRDVMHVHKQNRLSLDYADIEANRHRTHQPVNTRPDPI